MGEKNDGVDPSGKGADYQNWSWKEIKVAICGAVDTSHTNELSERHLVSEPQTFYAAADSFDIVRTKLQSAKDDTERYTKTLIGTEHDGWKGPTANAFRDMMNKFKGAFEGHLSPLVGPPSYRTTLEGAAVKLQKAIDDISAIDGEVADKVMERWKTKVGPFAALVEPPWHTEADGTTIVAVSTDKEMVEELTRRMRPVIQDLHNGFSVSTNDLHEPADVKYPSTGNGDGPNNGKPPPRGTPPPDFDHGGPPPPVVNLAKAPPPPDHDAPPPPPLDHAGPPPDVNGPLGPDGKPLLGPHGELLGADGKPLLGAHGELLNQAGAPLLDGAGKPILGFADPATKLADLGGLHLPGAGAVPPGVSGGALPGGVPSGSTGLSGLGGGPLLPARPGLPGRGPAGNLGRLGRGPGAAGNLGRLGRGLGLPGTGAGKLTSGELGPRSRSALLNEELFGEHGQPGTLGRRGLGERQRAGGKAGFPADGDVGEGALGRNGMPGQGTGGGRGEGEGERERETWLEEDRDVWGAGGAPAGTLGRPAE
ncbi:MAG TPA: hypothetical protein VMU51_15935 [Mycobacteriales bacterium]|nr:hypothetical protein [Mycobacteriales bacterium]